MKKKLLFAGMLTSLLFLGACSKDNGNNSSEDYSGFKPGAAVTVQTDNFGVKYGDETITKTAWNTGEDEVIATATTELGDGLYLHADLVDEGIDPETRVTQSIAANNIVVLCYGGPMDANHGANACKKAPVSSSQFSIQPGTYKMMFYAHSNGAPSLALNSGTDVGNPADGTYLSYNADFKETNNAGVNAMYTSATVKVNDNGSVEVNGGSATNKISGLVLTPLYSQVKITCASSGTLTGISATVTDGASASSAEVISQSNVASTYSGTSTQAIAFSSLVSTGTDDGYINVIPKSGNFSVKMNATLDGTAYTDKALAFGATLTKGHRYNIKATINKTAPTTYTVNFVSNNTAYGTVNQPILYGGTDPTFTTATIANGYSATTESATTVADVDQTPKTGYKIVSWTKPDGTVINVTSTVYNGPDFTIGINGMLLVKLSPYNAGTWTANFEADGGGTTYTVTYDAHGGSAATASTVTAGNSVSLPATTRSGYTFNGWYTSETGGSRVGGAGDSYTPTASVTLHAQWTAEESNTYEVEWVNGYGGSVRTDTKTWGTNLTSPAAPTRSGYFFKGWAISPSTTVTVAANTSCTDASFGKSSYSNAKVTMTAIWDAMCGITTETRTTSHGLGLHFTGYFPSSGYILISKGTNTAGTGELRFYPRGNSSYVELTFTPTLTGTTTTYQYPVGDEAKKYFFGETDVTSVETYSYTYDETSGFYDVYISELQSEFTEGKYCAGISLLCTNHAYFPAMVKRCMFTCFGYSVKDSSCY